MRVDNSFADREVPNQDSRTRRAQTEDMDVRLCRAGGGYAVTGESGNLYIVDVGLQLCTCPDQQKSEVDRCKHLRRVDLELEAGTVPTPDGRLPEAKRVALDGGFTKSRTEQPCPDKSGRIEGPFREFDKYDRATGLQYFRCRECGVESIRKEDLEGCCRVRSR